MRPFRTYGRIVFLLLLVWGAASVTANLLVDPCARYPKTRVLALEDARRNGERMAKACRLREGGYRGLILGTSRGEIGLDPGAPAWDGRRVFNGSLSGGDWYEITAMARLGPLWNPLEVVVIELDLFPFGERRRPRPMYLKSQLAPEGEPVETSLANLFGWNADFNSVRVLRGAILRANGTGPLMRAISRPDGRQEFFGTGEDEAGRFLHSLSTNFSTTNFYNGYQVSDQAVNALSRAIRGCVSKGARVIVVLPPMHALQLECMHEAGVMDDYATLVGAVLAGCRDAGEEGGAAPEFWSFLSFEGACGETVPDSPDFISKSFIDAGHMRPWLGDILLAQVLQGKPPAPGTVRGVRLDVDSIAEHFLELERERGDYVRDHREEVLRVQAIKRETLALARFNLELDEASDPRRRE